VKEIKTLIEKEKALHRMQRETRRGILNNSLSQWDILLERSDKSITLSASGSVLTLTTGGVVKAEVDDRRGVRISGDTPN
jgi:hypothetical protein